MSKKKVNPRNIPVSMTDLNRAKTEARNQAITFVEAVVFTVLVDKFNGGDYIINVWRETQKLADEIEEGYVSVTDLIHTLKEEYGVEIYKESGEVK